MNYLESLKKAIISADTVAIFDNLLTYAIEEWASDIHIEPYEWFWRIRIRIDWILKEIVQYPINIHDSLIAKFKIESWQMRPDEKRLPQDARVSIRTLTWKEADLRANTLPTVFWEKLVMRIVDKSKKIPPLEMLWIEWINKKYLYNNINLPNWIILTTWPTWSWKSTTLYACLNYLNKTDVNITTFEDPVENKMIWLNQSQIRVDIWYWFVQWLRAALRQDPDIIMVWEIRDYETLEIAMDAAMTWHLVFSTIHTNSAVETITRVLNLWAKPFMLAWTFNLVIAQRLARKLCDCKTKVDIKSKKPYLYNYALETLKYFNKENLEVELKLRWITKEEWQDFLNWYAYEPVWCEKCNGWYKWRVWLYEMLSFEDEIKDLIIKWKTAFEIEIYALKNWMINLERDWIFKVIKWLTTLDEVYRLTKHKDYLKIFNL